MSSNDNQQSTFALEITTKPDPADLAVVQEGLTAFNETDVGPADKQALVVFVRDAHNAVQGGLSGYTAWGWLYIQWLWLAEPTRGQGLGGKLLSGAEAEAIARGCHGAFIDTFNTRARKTYEKYGYRSFGEMKDFPKGRSRVFLQKRLVES